MNRKTSICSSAFRVVVVAALALSYGCASGPSARDTVESMTDLGNETAKVKDTINQAVRSLDTLTSSQAGDIRNNLDAYTKSVNALDEQANLVRDTANKMKVHGDAYFKNWEEGSETITQERHAELSASYARIEEDMATANDSFSPFMASLKDVQSYLSLDPTLKGINSMSALVQKAKDNSVTVNSQLDTVLKDLNSVRGMLSTK